MTALGYIRVLVYVTVYKIGPGYHPMLQNMNKFQRISAAEVVCCVLFHKMLHAVFSETVSTVSLNNSELVKKLIISFFTNVDNAKADTLHSSQIQFVC